MIINKELLNKCLYFDVETASIEKDFGTLEIKNQRLSELWSKRTKYFRAVNKEYEDFTDSEMFKEKASLEPEFSKIVCVSFGTFNEKAEDGMQMFSVYGDDEYVLLNKVNKILNNAMVKGLELCGHNIKAFDIPFLGRRMLYNKIMPSQNIKLYGKKPWEITFLDTAEIFSFGSWQMQKTLSLDLLTCSMGIPSPKGKMDGSMVSEYYYSGKLSEIAEYCEEDVKAVMRVMESTNF